MLSAFNLFCLEPVLHPCISLYLWLLFCSIALPYTSFTHTWPDSTTVFGFHTFIIKLSSELWFYINQCSYFQLVHYSVFPIYLSTGILCWMVSWHVTLVLALPWLHAWPVRHPLPCPPPPSPCGWPAFISTLMPTLHPFLTSWCVTEYSRLWVECTTTLSFDLP